MAESSVALPHVDRECAVKNYQIYSLDSDGRIVQPPAIIFCDTDVDAIEHAGALAGGQAVEVRNGDRIVIRIDAKNPHMLPPD